MTEQADNKAGGGALNVLWLVVAIALLVGGLVGYYVLNGQPTALRYALVFVGLILSGFAFVRTTWGQEVWQFALGSRVELRKMVWPTVPDTRRTTLIVFLFVVVLGVFFWVIDWVLAWGTRHLLGTGA